MKKLRATSLEDGCVFRQENKMHSWRNLWLLVPKDEGGRICCIFAARNARRVGGSEWTFLRRLAKPRVGIFLPRRLALFVC